MFFLDTFLKELKPRFTDDAVDRLNYYYTAMILGIFAITLTGKQYVGEPIQCWVPAQFTGAWEQNTYFLPLDHYIPKEYSKRDSKEIGYYQWVPFVLGLMAILFYVPNMIWRMLNWQSGINVKSIIKMALDTENVTAEKREKNVKVVAMHIQDCLELQHELKAKGRFLGFLFYGKRYGSYITGLYIFIKVLYLVNIIGQFFILNDFLGFPHHRFWGLEVLIDLANGREWEESGHFPRVTMCDFEVRVLGNLHRYTVQCVLMINMFNEKIFLFLWWWLVIVGIITAVNLLFWIYDILIPRERGFVMRYLRVSESLKASDKPAVNHFVDRGLRPDGVLLLRLIAANAGDILATDLINELWTSFKQRHRPPPPPSITNGEKPYQKGDDIVDPGLESLYPAERRTPPRAGAPPLLAKHDDPDL